MPARAWHHLHARLRLKPDDPLPQSTITSPPVPLHHSNFVPSSPAAGEGPYVVYFYPRSQKNVPYIVVYSYPGMKQDGIDIDAFQETLIEDMELWTKGYICGINISRSISH
jgi:hypothetical protein